MTAVQETVHVGWCEVVWPGGGGTFGVVQDGGGVESAGRGGFGGWHGGMGGGVGGVDGDAMWVDVRGRQVRDG